MKILILDIETTNFLDRGGRIVEIGIVELNLETGEIKIIFDELTHEKGITREECENSWIVQNSDMTVEDIRHSDNLEKLRPKIQKILNSYPLGATAFNNEFDFGFLENRNFVFPKKLPCPMKLATDICKITNRKSWGGKYKWPNVEEAYNHFVPNNDYVEQHRGADDAKHEAVIVYELYKMGEFKID